MKSGWTERSVRRRLQGQGNEFIIEPFLWSPGAPKSNMASAVANRSKQRRRTASDGPLMLKLKLGPAVSSGISSNERNICRSERGLRVSHWRRSYSEVRRRQGNQTGLAGGVMLPDQREKVQGRSGVGGQQFPRVLRKVILTPYAVQGTQKQRFWPHRAGKETGLGPKPVGQQRSVGVR